MGGEGCALPWSSLRLVLLLRSHKGLTVEIGNTDAEGRLVLADALSLVQARQRMGGGKIQLWAVCAR